MRLCELLQVIHRMDQGIVIALGDPGLQQMQQAYIESFNGKFRDECLNEHWVSHLPGGAGRD